MTAKGLASILLAVFLSTAVVSADVQVDVAARAVTPDGEFPSFLLVGQETVVRVSVTDTTVPLGAGEVHLTISSMGIDVSQRPRSTPDSSRPRNFASHRVRPTP